MYTTSSETSAGKIGPFVGGVQQEVNIAEGSYFNYLRLGPLTGKLEATWEVMNPEQWKVRESESTAVSPLAGYPFNLEPLRGFDSGAPSLATLLA